MANIGFNLGEESTTPNESRMREGQWYYFDTGAPNTLFAGRLEQISDEEIVLNPSVKDEYTEDGPRRELVTEKNSSRKTSFKKSLILGVKSTSEESLEYYCRYTNERIRLEYKEQKLRVERLKRGLPLDNPTQ